MFHKPTTQVLKQTETIRKKRKFTNMKSSRISILFSVLGLITVLGLLRFKPWKSFENTESEKQIVHQGPNDKASRSLNIGYLPVTCHLTCPVTDYASKTTKSRTNFNSQRFMDFPTVVSALESKQLQASFMIAPLALKMREDGVPVKICYLGHRDGSELVVAKNSKAKTLRDLKGKTIAVPSLYSNQNLVLHKLMADEGLTDKDVNFVVLPPPDMPTSLASGAIDGYFVGEPFCAKAELEGYGRVLYYARDIWPGFVSCALVVHEDLIKENPEIVKDLVRGIAESGEWAQNNRAAAAKLVAPYYRQDQKVLDYVLTSKPARVNYTGLTPTEKEFNQIQDMAVSMGIIKKKIPINDLLDKRFIPEIIEQAKIDNKKIPDAE